jgi:hypothetical protein
MSVVVCTHGIGVAASGPSQKGYSGGYVHWSAFRKAIENLCRQYNILDNAEYLSARYWPAFSRLDDAGQRAFWQVLGVQEVSDVCSKNQGGQCMPPRIAIFVWGGVVQEVASDTTDVLIKLLDLDSIEEGDPPDEWRPPDVVIHDPRAFDAYTSGGQTP